MDVPQIEALLETLRAEHATVGTTIASLEQLLKLRSEATAVSPAAPVERPKADKNGANPTAIKGTISIRRAITQVLQQAKQPMHAKDIWRLAHALGARTAAKSPVAIVSLSAIGIDGVEKVGPRLFEWKGE